MMKKLIIMLLSLTATFFYASAQDIGLLTSLENGRQIIRQLPGTDRLLSKLLKDAGVKEDTVYAYIYKPASCPRCESGFKANSRYLRKKGEKFVLITVLGDKQAAEFYNKKNKYLADYYIYDTNDEFTGIFSFNTIPLNIPFLLKLTRSGRLVTGYDGSWFSRDLSAALMARSEPLDYKDFKTYKEDDAGNVLYALDKARLNTLDGKYTDYKLDVSPEAPLGEIFRNPNFIDDMFFYPDELLGGVSLFRQKKGTDSMSFEACMKACDDEKDRFVDIDTTLYNSLTADNDLYYIICNTALLDKNHIGMSYSLPRVFMEAPDNMAYYNTACMLSRKLPSLVPDSMMDFKIGEYDGYFYKHFQFCPAAGNIVIGCEKLSDDSREKTVPTAKDKAADKFCHEFYDTDTYLFAAFDRVTGERKCRFGRLDPVARKSLTGYFYTDPVAVSGGAEIAYTDGYSGKVYVADTSALEKVKNCYTVFALDESLLPAPDSTNFYKGNYDRVYRGFFCRNIMDIRVTPDKLYCMLCYGDSMSFMCKTNRYTFVTIDRKTGERREYLYPEEKGTTVFTRGLRDKEGLVYPFMLLKQDGKALLRVYAEGETGL